jgi:HSP20 family protein
MPKEKRSFFERLTGSVSLDEEEDEELLEDDAYEQQPEPRNTYEEDAGGYEEYEWEEPEGQLGVDVYHTAETLVIKAIVAGVSPEDLDVSITRDMVTIRGRREERQEVADDDYFYKELYWGNFSRTIVLPQEIEVEEAEANEKHGLLVITLPKVDKEKQTKLKVKAS